jgi:hypothetical protein
LLRLLESGQYTSWAFTRRAVDSGLVPSMGSIGDCYDNGQMESFWARMQVELLNRKRWNTRLELANAIFGRCQPLWDRFFTDSLSWVSVLLSCGLLIHAAAGSSSGVGGLRTNRSGCAV